MIFKDSSNSNHSTILSSYETILVFLLHAGKHHQKQFLCISWEGAYWEPKWAEADQEFINEVKCQINFINSLNQLPMVWTIQ